jgi:DNA polymerase III delta subunit
MSTTNKHYFFYGENLFERKQAIEQFLQTVPPDFQLAVFSVDDCLENSDNFALLKEQFLTENFDGQKYIFHIKNLDTLYSLQKKFLPAKKNRTLADLSQIQNNLWVHLVLFFIKAMQTNPEEHLLLLESNSDKLLWESYFLKILQKETTAHSFPKEKKTNNIAGWVRAQLLKNGLSCQPEVIQTLLDFCLSDKIKISKEIEKFKLFNKPLTPKLISQTIEMAEIPIFVFLENITTKNKFFLQKKLHIFFQKQSPQEMQKFFALLAIEFRKILKIKWLMESGQGHKLATHLKIPAWLIKKSIHKAKCFSTKEVENILQYLQNNDLAIKYAGTNANLLLQQFCLQITTHFFAKS